MNILHVVNIGFPVLGGHSIRNHNIFKALKDQQIEFLVIVSIFSLNPSCLEYGQYVNKDGVDYYHLLSEKIIKKYKKFQKYSWLNKPLQFYLAILNFKLICSKLEINKYDIIHGHSGYNNGLSAYFVAKKYRKKFVYDLHALSIDNIKKSNSKYFIARMIEIYLMKKADSIIVIDEGLRKHITASFNINHHKIFVAPNGIDPLFFKKSKTLRKLIVQNRYIVGVDNSKEIENFKFIFNNRQKIIDEFPDIYFVVFANKDKNLFLEEDYFKILPRVNYDEMPEYYCLLDLFILPRLRNKMTETVTPLKILEIMSCEIPVLVSDVQGLSSCVVPEDTGFTFTVDDINSLISAIDWIRKYPNLQKVVKAARKWVCDNKSWAFSASCYLKAYKSVRAN